ncbi:MAG: hypothetical protein JETT_0610 [Candidatus Jettenia ecosi]|uniref:Uncharacterized protein n=1 Tax=Candidatus Jettenia ecosi TaxID=2494326 RepID=A0A533QQZ2_9BACT|nr:MAG: hypothetical protein JETT_0610 [Candidatus Jettenia ecosi]
MFNFLFQPCLNFFNSLLCFIVYVILLCIVTFSSGSGIFFASVFRYFISLFNSFNSILFLFVVVRLKCI